MEIQLVRLFLGYMAGKLELTSCRRKLMRPVAMTGFPIQIYQATHCFSNQLRAARSVAPYSVSNSRGALNVAFVAIDNLAVALVDLGWP